MRIRPELIIGVALVIVSFIALFLVANIINPPSQYVLVAVRDIQPGEQLSPELARAVAVELPFIENFILEMEADRFDGALFVESVHANEPIHKASLVSADNPAAASRSSLALDDPGLVAFVVPVSPETAPPDVAIGDRVDLTLGVGSATFLSGSFSVVPTPNPYQPNQVFVGEWSSSDRGEVESESSSQSFPITQGSTATEPDAPQRVTLPVAKTLVRGARVLRVVHEQRVNPGFTGEGQSSYIFGDIQALVLAVPLEAQEVLTFALANGDVRVAVLSPVFSQDESRPTLGMSWDDLIAFFYAEREQGLQDINSSESLLGPGASVLWPTQQILLNPTATPKPEESGELASATATPSIVPEATPTP